MLILLTIFFTYLKMTEERSKRRFLSVIFTVLSFRKPLLLRVFENNNLFSHGSWQFFKQTNVLPVQPIYTEPRVQFCFRLQHSHAIKNFHGSEGSVSKKGWYPCKSLSIRSKISPHPRKRDLSKKAIYIHWNFSLLVLLLKLALPTIITFCGFG